VNCSQLGCFVKVENIGITTKLISKSTYDKFLQQNAQLPRSSQQLLVMAKKAGSKKFPRKKKVRKANT